MKPEGSFTAVDPGLAVSLADTVRDLGQVSNTTLAGFYLTITPEILKLITVNPRACELFVTKILEPVVRRFHGISIATTPTLFAYRRRQGLVLPETTMSESPSATAASIERPSDDQYTWRAMKVARSPKELPAC